MAKGDDSRRKKLNKGNRKRLNKDSSSAVSARVAALIASKKRRKSGKRRQCEGMCFSLPTPEDPFNERKGKKDVGTKNIKKAKPSREKVKTSAETNGHSQKKRSIHDQKSMDEVVSKRPKIANSGNEQNLKARGDKLNAENIAKTGKGKQPLKKPVSPSKFFLLCLKSILDAFLGDEKLDTEQGKTLDAEKWGVEFWKSYSSGKDILETNGSNPTVQQIAWIASIAADTIANKEKDGGSCTSPILVYLVPSQKDATKVRSVCKPLKALGVHTVSLHPGASIEHQIHGLKSCEPEFIVATPERLWELVSLEVIDLSDVSLLVVDGLAGFCESGSLDVLKCIRQSLSVSSRVAVFGGCPGGNSIEAVHDILKEPIAHLSLGK